MKEISIIILCLCCFGMGGYCQTFAEWWRQKKTRLKYLRLQELALQKLQKVTAKGYDIAETGVDSIGRITNEELLLHEEQYKSLHMVKPAFMDRPELMASYSLVSVFLDRIAKSAGVYGKCARLSRDEKVTILEDMLIAGTDIKRQLDDLIQLSTGEDLALKDGQRWDRIYRIEYDIRVAYEMGMMRIRRMDHLIGLREQQAANDAFLRQAL